MSRRSKYGAVPVFLDGHRFASKREAARYGELRLLEQAGEIGGLEVHPRFELESACLAAGGARVRAVVYEGDFRYRDLRRDAEVVEDVKGVRTAVYRLKRRLFLRRYPGIDFREVR